MYMSNLFQTYFTFFSLSLLFLDFLTTLVQLGSHDVVTGKLPQLFYYNLSKGENRKDVSTTNTTCSAHTPFFLC